MKVVQAESPYFSIISPPDVGHKVAPGMDTIFYIQFNPDQKKVPFVIVTFDFLQRERSYQEEHYMFKIGHFLGHEGKGVIFSEEGKTYKMKKVHKNK